AVEGDAVTPVVAGAGDLAGPLPVAAAVHLVHERVEVEGGRRNDVGVAGVRHGRVEIDRRPVEGAGGVDVELRVHGDAQSPDRRAVRLRRDLADPLVETAGVELPDVKVGDVGTGQCQCIGALLIAVGGGAIVEVVEVAEIAEHVDVVVRVHGEGVGVDVVERVDGFRLPHEG